MTYITHDGFSLEIEREKYETLLIKCLEHEIEDDSLNICSNCGHLEANHIYPKYIEMMYKESDRIDGIRLHLRYSADFKKVFEIRVEYDCDIGGFCIDYYNTKRQDEIYNLETDEDIEMRFGDVLELPKHYYPGNFYYIKNNISKRLYISVEEHMGYYIWGCKIYTRDSETRGYTETLDCKYYGTNLNI